MRRPFSIRLAIACAILWLLAFALAFAGDKGTAFAGLGNLVYSTILAALTLWLIPRVTSSAESDFLIARGSRIGLCLRYVIVAASILWLVGVNNLAAAGVHVWPFTQWIHLVGPIRITPYIGGFALQNFISEALVPGLLLLLAGATAVQLGLTRPVRGTWRATAACLVLPAIFVGIALAQHRLSIEAVLLGIIVRNLLSNGFSEEFLIRGALFSHLRSVMPREIAFYAQAVVFAVLHFEVNTQGGVATMLASVIVLNLPTGLLMGFLTLRSRSLIMPSIVHMSLDAMKDVL